MKVAHKAQIKKDQAKSALPPKVPVRRAGSRKVTRVWVERKLDVGARDPPTSALCGFGVVRKPHDCCFLYPDLRGGALSPKAFERPVKPLPKVKTSDPKKAPVAPPKAAPKEKMGEAMVALMAPIIASLDSISKTLAKLSKGVSGPQKGVPATPEQPTPVKEPASEAKEKEVRVPPRVGKKSQRDPFEGRRDVWSDAWEHEQRDKGFTACFTLLRQRELFIGRIRRNAGDIPAALLAAQKVQDRLVGGFTRRLQLLMEELAPMTAPISQASTAVKAIRAAATEVGRNVHPATGQVHNHPADADRPPMPSSIKPTVPVGKAMPQRALLKKQPALASLFPTPAEARRAESTDDMGFVRSSRRR